jgi:energy-coupling factor transport system ATP-binding protein
MSEFIVLKDIDYAYDEKPLFNHLSLELEKGKVYAIIGHNGSGKSTLAKIIGGLFYPQGGRYILDGTLINPKNLYLIRQKVGMVFQNPDNQFLGSTILEDIAFGLENRCIPQPEMDAIILEYATKVGMDKYLDKEPTQLSGGQKQRVALAGVLAMKPELLILDEATSMLDVKGKMEIDQLFKDAKVNFADLTILMITHDLDEAMMADEIILLDHGQVIAKDTPQNLFNNIDLSKYALTIPFALEVSLRAKDMGIDIEKCYTFEDLNKALWQYLSKK